MTIHVLYEVCHDTNTLVLSCFSRPSFSSSSSFFSSSSSFSSFPQHAAAHPLLHRPPLLSFLPVFNIENDRGQWQNLVPHIKIANKPETFEAKRQRHSAQAQAGHWRRVHVPPLRTVRTLRIIYHTYIMYCVVKSARAMVPVLNLPQLRFEARASSHRASTA